LSRLLIGLKIRDHSCHFVANYFLNSDKQKLKVIICEPIDL
jgi:hypothetical protein